jgi:hypothetical protein
MQVSVRMAELLEPEKSKRVPPHRNNLCLKCHSVDGANPQVAAEGVGCAACHGSSENWLTMHYLPSWKAKHNSEKADYGFIPTKNLVARISNCATCHVGSADREVNHDLIAAGHPRLAFEYTRFHFQPIYQKHWNEKLGTADFESRAWVIGQVASLRAAVEVLQARANHPEKAPWPEFAGYSCYACHQTVGTNEPRGTGPNTGRALGWPGWEVWYTATAAPAAKAAEKLFPGVSPLPLDRLDKLRALMDRRPKGDKTPPAPTRKQVADLTSPMLADLENWLAAVQAAEDGPLPAASYLVAGLGQSVACNALGADKTLRDHDWDFLAAHYLGASAFHHAGGVTNPGQTEALKAIGKELQFPRIKRGERFDSPGVFGKTKLKQVQDNFGRLKSGLDTSGGSR